MNPRLDQLHPYPFQKLRELFAGVTPNPQLAPINLSIGEPKHPTPAFIKDALVAGLAGLIYGSAGLPASWLSGLQNQALVLGVVDRFVAHMQKK